MSFASNRIPFRTRLSHSLLGLALLAGGAAALPSTAMAGVFVSVNIAPPPLPVYVHPPIPAPGYLWVPGYWAYDDDGGYFWVPGTWVDPPYAGALWTPAWWGWSGDAYVFHTGYWGPRVGFYGGINYGFGYTGVGYAGGYWNRDRFYYNRSVNNVSTRITNVYNKTVINNVTVNRTSYNGGPGGIAARANAQELQAARMQHSGPVAAQRQQMSMAAQNRELRASANHGAPAIAATPRAGAFAAREAMPAHAAMAPANLQAHVPHATLPSASFAPHANRAPTPQPRGLDMASPRPAQPMHNTAPAYRNEAPQRASYAGEREMPRAQPSHAYAPQAYHAAPMSAYRPQQGGGHPQPAAHAQAPRGHAESHEKH